MSNQQATTLEVQGMSCPSCIRHVTAALSDVDGVARVEVKLRDGVVIVEHDIAAAPVHLLIRALTEAGYASRPRQDVPAASATPSR